MDTPPIQRKSALKKRLSTAASSETASPLQPSRHENVMNDDAAERAARRKSAHFGDLAAGEGTKAKEGKRIASGLAVQQSAQAGGAVGHKKAKRLSAVAPAAPVVSMEVMNTNFEEWMKLATDNVGLL